MSKIVTVRIKDIEANPFRALGEYPYVERKLEALKRSIEDIGLWEGVIARETKDKYQLAFGHHRVEAARRVPLKEIPIIVRTLTDEQMLQFMGRENMEDYNADFLCMLETWEAAVKFTVANVKNTKPSVIANLLGWTDIRSHTDAPQLNSTARACNAAHALITGGYLDRNDLREITVSAAQHIVERAQSRIEQLERLGKDSKRPAKEIEQAKRQIARGAKATAKDVRAERIAHREIRGQVDLHAYKYAQEKNKQLPLFSAFGKTLVKSIEDSFGRDHFSEKLEQIANSVDQITLEDDHAILRQLDFALSEVPRRTENWRKRLIPKGKKVQSLKLEAR